MKKTLSFLLAFLMIVTMVPVLAITSFASTEEATPDIGKIGTWADLIALESDADGGTYELTANIKPTTQELAAFKAPIKLKSITLNGNGYTVSGFAGANSLFTMDTDAGKVTIQNLVVGAAGETYTGVSVLMEKVSANTYLTVDGVKVKGNLNGAGGAFIGTSTGTVLISNSVNLANVTGTYASGMIRSASAGSIIVTNFINEGVICGTTDTAGVLANASGDVTMEVDGFSNYANIKDDGTNGNAAGVVSCWASNGALVMKNILSTADIYTYGKRSGLTVAILENVSANVTIENAVALYNTKARWSAGHLFGHINTSGKLTVKNCVVSGMRTLLNPSWSKTAYTYDYFALGDDSKTSNKDYSGNFYDVTIEVRKFTSGTNTTQTHAPVAFADAVTPVDSQTSTVLAKSDNGATLLADKAAVLSKLNEATYTGAFGSFKWADAEKSAIVQASPAIKGIQFGKVSGEGEDATYSARLVATIQDTLYYENIGFEITVGEGNAKIHYSANVYGTIYGNENGLITYTAQELGGEYVYGLVINNIPADDAVTLTIRTYAKDKAVDGEGAAIEYFGAAQTITIEGGAVTYQSGANPVGWSLDFPRYEGGTLMKGYYGVNYGYESISAPNIKNYKQLCAYGTNEAEFNAYVQTLTEEGYTLTEVNNDAFIKSYWVEKDGMRMYMYLSVNAGEARFILDQNEAVSMEEFSYTYAKQTGDNTALYLYGLHMDKKEGKNVGEKYSDGTTNLKASNCGQMFIIKLADNSVVVIDGGADNQMSKEAAEGLDTFLHEITDNEDGSKGKVKIACWLITHPHMDHFGGFARFLINYHESYDLERICFNFNYIDSNLPKLFDEHLDVYYPDLMYYRPHTGETIQLADVTLDILYTCEDNVDAETGELIKEHFTWNNTYGIDQNNSSMVARITFDGKTFMLLGDIYGAAQAVIIKNYSKESLKADIMQVAHHGFNNLPELVAAINPSVSLYPQSEVGAVKANSGTANTVLQNVIQNTEGGKDNLYFAGECTARVEVVDGALQVTTSDVISADYDGAWTIFTPFE